MSILRAPQATEIISALCTRLPEGSVRHSISVASWMAALARNGGWDEHQAIWAGLLHDYCKAENDADLVKAAEGFKLPLSSLHHERPALLHGPVAAEKCRSDLGIHSDEVYEAIFWHTTGRPGLGPIGLALYFADFTEPFRTMPEADKARAILRREGFDAALRYAVEAKTGYVEETHGMDGDTHAFRAWMFNGVS
jgi:predicted HD superfamily hydrolase involved in NAD metabolism